MAVDTATVWGQDVANAVDAVGISAGTEITPAQLALVWKAIKQVTIDNLAKADVAAGSFVDGNTIAVTGVGGPVT